MVKTVILMNDVTIPPEFVPLIIYIVRLNNSVGVPLIIPVDLSKVRPSGRLGSIDQSSISPEPVTFGNSGRSLLVVLFVKVRSVGE